MRDEGPSEVGGVVVGKGAVVGVGAVAVGGGGAVVVGVAVAVVVVGVEVQPMSVLSPVLLRARAEECFAQEREFLLAAAAEVEAENRLVDTLRESIRDAEKIRELATQLVCVLVGQEAGALLGCEVFSILSNPRHYVKPSMAKLRWLIDLNRIDPELLRWARDERACV